MSRAPRATADGEPPQGSIYRRAFRHLAPILRPRRMMLFVAAVALLASVGFDLLKPWPLKFVLDNLIPGVSFLPAWAHAPGLDERTWMLLVICLMIVAAAGLSAIAAYLREFVLNRLGEEIGFELRVKLFAHVQRLGLGFHDSARMGDTITRITDDTRSIRDVATTSVLQVAQAVVQITGMLLIMALMDWRLALVGFLTVPMLGPTVWYYRSKIEKASRKRRKREGELTSVAQETMSSIRLVKTLGSEERQQSAFGEESSKSAEIGLEVARLEASYVRTVDVIVALVTCGVVWAGAERVWAGSLTIGGLTLFLYYIKNLLGPLRDVAKQSSKISKGKVGLERVLELLEEVPTVTDAPGARTAPPLGGRIAFEGVGFGYDADRHVLANIAFRAEPGQVVALVGHSGAGKTTILSLISRLYDPSAGRVLVDGADIRDYTIESLRDQISVVLQESVLLQTSIYENILYGRADATREQVLAAAAAAGVGQFIERLPEGYDTVVGARGAMLSGGERQRVAIARSIVRGAPILLLDEPTTGLDAKSEQLVMQGLNRLMEGKTTLLVSHKLCLVERADLILVLDRGRIVESGTSAELLRRGGLYAQLRAAAAANDGELLEDLPVHSVEPHRSDERKSSIP
jgi:ABC-type multidrug transport system fused ATPase/permease subunit